jgi:hypothetical protein
VSPLSVRQHLEEGRTLARACAGDGLFGRRPHGQHVVAIDGLRRHRVAARAISQAIHGGGRVERRVLAVEVVLADEDDGEMPDRGQVHRLVERPDVRRPVPEEGDRGIVGTSVHRREGSATREGKMGTDDRERAERSYLDVGEMHRPTHAPAHAIGLPEDLCHASVRRSAHREQGPVTAVGACHRVAGTKRRAHPDRNRLLPLVEVGRAPHELLQEQPRDLVLERSDLHHLTVKLEEVLTLDRNVGRH